MLEYIYSYMFIYSIYVILFVASQNHKHKVLEDRLRWFGHVQRRDSEHIGRRMFSMGLKGRR